MDSDLFPLKSVGDARKLFERHLNRGRDKNGSKKLAAISKTCAGVEDEPNLVLLSIVAGAIENNMTLAKSLSSLSDSDSSRLATSDTDSESQQEEDVTSTNTAIEPHLDWSTVESLLSKFDGIIRGFCDVDLLAAAQKAASENDDLSFEKVRKLIKHVADIIWNTLSKSHYKDKPHLQSIYSYLTGNKLDCFGVAFAVVASCQLLQVANVHLALSEDHAWVVFGKDGTETAEVTWHGKGNEDKRGRPVDIAKAKTSWLYLAGQPVVCDRYIEVAAIVSSINPSVNSNCDSIEVGILQQELLWLLYDLGHLKNYPMALGNLADLEEISKSIGRPSCQTILNEAIETNRTHYNNQHVYPYTYQAGFYYRTKDYEKALKIWADAADVIKLYRYSKDDEEIYKEFMEIANELIPSIVKVSTSGSTATSGSITTSGSVTTNSKCFSDILRFYDGLCSWEEGSPTPVLHIGWAKHMVATCSKFSAEVRSGVQLGPETEEEEEDDDEEEGTTMTGKFYSGSSPLSLSGFVGQEDNNNYYKNSDCDSKRKEPSTTRATPCDNFNDSQEHLSKMINAKFKSDWQNNILIQNLSSLCALQTLNIDFLLGKTNKPFLESAQTIRAPKATTSTTTSPTSDLHPSMNIDNDQSLKSISEKPAKREKILLELHSAKMRGMRGLLCSEKLNTSAITLQLTAQSQTEVTSHRKINEDSALGSSRSKRPRRDT